MPNFECEWCRDPVDLRDCALVPRCECEWCRKCTTHSEFCSHDGGPSDVLVDVLVVCQRCHRQRIRCLHCGAPSRTKICLECEIAFHNDNEFFRAEGA